MPANLPAMPEILMHLLSEACRSSNQPYNCLRPCFGGRFPTILNGLLPQVFFRDKCDFYTR